MSGSGSSDVYVIIGDPRRHGDALARIEGKLDQLLRGQQAMANELSNLEAQVAQNTTLEESAVTLIKGLADQIAAMKDDPARLAKLSADLKARADSLAAAIQANVPPPPAPPAP